MLVSRTRRAAPAVSECRRYGGGMSESDAVQDGGGQWVPTEAGAHLRGRRVRDTTPEIAIRRVLHARGLRFRLQRTLIGPCRPDLIFPCARVAVFVDGCYWHGCPTHGPTVFRGPNADRWRSKINDNQQRDRRNDRALETAGWHVERIWECEIRSDLQAVADHVEGAVRGAGAASDARGSTLIAQGAG